MKFARSLIKDFMLEKISEFKTTTYTKQNNEIATKEFKKLFNYYIKYEFREQILDEIVKEFSNDDEIFRELYMSESNLVEMCKENMIIGSHSKSHFVFSKLNKKERLFCMVAYTPKATVQAALGTVPRAMGLSCGEIVLTVAVISILITAPFGAICVDNSYKKLLSK